MTHRAACRILLLVACLLIAGGCSVKAEDPARVLDVTPPVGLDIDLFNGDVELVADPSATETSVVVTRVATHGAKRRKEAKASLDEIDYTVEIVTGDLGPVVQIRSTTRHAEPHFQRTNVLVTAPEIAGIKLRTRNGRVVARDATGPFDVSTSFGDVRIMSNKAITDDVTILNTEGDIDFRVRGDSTGRIDAVSVGGAASLKANYGEVIIYPESRRHTVRADLNNATNNVVLRTVNGNIRIAVVDRPQAVGLKIVH